MIVLHQLDAGWTRPQRRRSRLNAGLLYVLYISVVHAAPGRSDAQSPQRIGTRVYAFNAGGSPVQRAGTIRLAHQPMPDARQDPEAVAETIGQRHTVAEAFLGRVGDGESGYKRS